MQDVDHGRAARHWDERHFDPGYSRQEWSFHPAALARLATLLGYNCREEWFWAKYLNGRNHLRGIGIGVGLAQTELSLLSTGVFARYDLYDLSPLALDSARREAEAIGFAGNVGYVCEDIAFADLGKERYDLVTFIASLHHIAALDETLRKCKEALKPGGHLWAVEYIGPDRFQYPDEHTEFARRFYRSLHPGVKKLWTPELQFPTREEVVAADPTEAIHSSRIPAAIHATFDKVETIYTYGTFAFILSWGLLADALYEAPLGREFMTTILDIDTLLIDSGKLPHYFAFFVATK